MKQENNITAIGGYFELELSNPKKLVA